MEITNGNFSMGLVSRAIAFAMALATTAFITTATAVVLASGTPIIGT